MSDPRETSWDWYSDEKTATMCSNEAVWIRKLTALAEQYPEDVVIREVPEDNGGVILANLPKKWLKIKFIIIRVNNGASMLQSIPSALRLYFFLKSRFTSSVKTN